jgi:hypothetical protein
MHTVWMHADRDYAPGEEVFWSYGVKSNVDLFYSYSFIIDRNIDDFILIEGVQSSRLNLPCPEEDLTAEGCLHRVFPSRLSQSFLHYCRVFKTKNDSIPPL